MGIKDEELAGLSDEERAALEDDDDESEIIGKIAGDDGSDDDEGDNDDDESTTAISAEAKIDGQDSGESGDEGKQAGAAAAKSGDGAESSAAEPDAVAEFQPTFTATQPEGLTEKLADIETQIKALRDMRREGNIELDAYDEQKEALDAQKMTLLMQAEQAKFAVQQNDDIRTQRWKWEQERFFGQASAEIYKDGIVMAALNASVKQLSNDPANAKRPAAWFLEEADRQVRSRFNMGETAKPADDKAKSKEKERQPDLSNLPKTLANLPAADVSETGGDEFAYLDKLDGIALEVALRKLTSDQEARYLGAA